MRERKRQGKNNKMSSRSFSGAWSSTRRAAFYILVTPLPVHVMTSSLQQCSLNRRDSTKDLVCTGAKCGMGCVTCVLYRGFVGNLTIGDVSERCEGDLVTCVLFNKRALLWLRSPVCFSLASPGRECGIIHTHMRVFLVLFLRLRGGGVGARRRVRGENYHAHS